MDRQPLTQAVFTAAKMSGVLFNEHADTLLDQLPTLVDKPVCRFVVPPLDHEMRRRLLMQLSENDWMCTIRDAFVLYDNTPFYYTHVEVLSLAH